MRKFFLMLAAVLAVLSTGALTTGSNAAVLGDPAGIRAAIDQTQMTETVAIRCTHWWNGRYHRVARCWNTRPRIVVPRIVIGPRYHRWHGRRW